MRRTFCILFACATLSPAAALAQAVVLSNPTPNTSLVLGNDGGQSVAASASTFAVLSGPATTNFGTELNAAQVQAAKGLYRSMYCQTRVAPGAGQTFTVTLRVNSASPANGPSCVISGTATTGSDTTNTASVNAADVVDVNIVASSGSATTSNIMWGIEFLKTPN